MKEGRNLVVEALNDAKALKEAAISAAKNELLESMAPAIKNLLEKNIKDALESEGVNRMRRVGQDYPGESKSNFEESTQTGADNMASEELDLENVGLNLESLFSEEEDCGAEGGEEKPVEEEGAIPTLGETKDNDEDDKKDVEEGIEISESELRKVYEAALQTEVQVKKGFSEMTPNGEIDDVVKDVDKGLADVKKGEHNWEKETPPAKQDFMVKEAIRKGMAENKALRENLKKAVGMIRTLGTRLHEVNLFNAKVLHVNKILNKSGRLTAEQKRVVLESIDKARSISEVKTVYEVVTSSFAAASGNLSESVRKPSANAQRARTSGAADQKVLRESVDRGSNETLSRLATLAGLTK